MLRGANINGQSIALGGMSALSLVAICGTTTTAQTLLDNGADSNIQMENGKNAYELAKQWNRTEMANILEAYTEKATLDDIEDSFVLSPRSFANMANVYSKNSQGNLAIK